MSELETQIVSYLDELRRDRLFRAHRSAPTNPTCGSFSNIFRRREPSRPRWPNSTSCESASGWRASTIKKLDRVSMRRKLASLRSFFQSRWCGRASCEFNPARLVLTPKAGQKLPVVMTAETANALVDAPPSEQMRAAWPARDRVMLEFLYGCGLRASELVGMNLDDIDFAERWVRVRGKGRKERQVPFGKKAAAALERYLGERAAATQTGETAVFLNRRGGRITTRGVQGIVKLYALVVAGDSSIHPHSFRHAYATHLLSDGADLRAVQELLGHARLSTTQKYTQLSLTDLMSVYDRAHPKA